MFTKQEVNYLVKLIGQDVETTQKNLDTARKTIVKLRKHKGSFLDDDEKMYLYVLFSEQSQRIYNGIMYKEYNLDEIEKTIKMVPKWLKIGIPAARKFFAHYRN